MNTFGTHPANLLETIFDQVSIAVIVADAQRRIVYANEQALQLFRVPRTSGPSQFDEWARNCHYFDSSGNEISVEQLSIMRVLAGEDVEPRYIKLVLPDGSFRWVHSSAYRFSVMGLSGALAVATDETHEVELRRLALDIQKFEVLSALAGALAHNFNNIVSVISLSAFAGLQSPDAGPVARAKLQQILDASRHASDLTKRLAQFSRTQRLQPRLISLNNVIRDVLAMIEPLLSRNIKVIAALHPDLPNVEIDDVEMEQVLVNLMLNARDAMPQGGVLTVATDVQVRPSGARIRGDDKQCVCISVSDTGSGIAETIMEHLFEPFFTTKSNGIGLGLASTQGIVRQHGGDIKVQSAAGKGTEFTVYLPPSREVAAAA
jgi:signal transduction histidine kinase